MGDLLALVDRSRPLAFPWTASSAAEQSSKISLSSRPRQRAEFMDLAKARELAAEDPKPAPCGIELLK